MDFSLERRGCETKIFHEASSSGHTLGDKLYDHIVSEESVIFTDGGSAISASVGLMCHGNGHVLSCALHLLANVKKPRNRDTGFSDALFWRLQAAETEEAFETIMEDCARVSDNSELPL